MTLSAADFRDIEKLFKNDICRQCGICKNLKNPDFCTHYFVEKDQQFVIQFVVLLKYIKFEKPKLYEALMTPEGFAALFCDESMCPNYNKNRCADLEMSADCYQLFKYQDSIDLDAGLSRQIVADWDEDLFEDLCKNLDIAACEIQKLPKKKRKRLFKIGKSSLSKLKSIKNKKIACGYTSIKQIKAANKKPPVSTQWFGRSGYINIVKSILEGTYKQFHENNNRKQLVADECGPTNKIVVHPTANIQ